jgi:hypothetical protein
MRSIFCAIAVVVVACLAADSAHAQDPFEIEVYDATANPVGVPGLELHLNDWVTGHRFPSGSEAPLHGQFHATFEPSWGVLPFWEVGAYVQFAVRTDDGVADWAGAKLRSKFVTPPTWDAHWRLGINLEVSYLPAIYDANRWGSEVRPIVAYEDERWLFAFNPIFDQALARPGASDGPVFDPALKAARKVGPVALGFEYYGGIGPVASPLPLADQTHLLFEVIDLLSIDHVELNLGLGEGLTPASAGMIVKAIIGYTFERSATPPPPLAPQRIAR